MGIDQAVDLYLKIGSAGVIVILFVFMLVNLMKENKSQTAHIDEIQLDLATIKSEITNTMSICVKLIDSINNFKGSNNDKLDRKFDKLNENLDDLSNSIAYLQGKWNGGSK